MDPHSPYDPPARYREATGPWPLWAPSDPDWGTPQIEKDGRSLDVAPDEKRYAKSLYEGEIRYVDEQIGRLTEELARLGRLDDTFVCVTADHGEEFWDHGWVMHGQSLYEDQVRVPLIIAGPGLENGVIEEPISAVDLMPTLTELVGLLPSEEWRGMSWAAALKEGNSPDAVRPVFAQATYIEAVEPLQMVVSEDRKLIRGSGSGRLELYNVTNDPSESRNIFEQENEQHAELAGMLDQWLDSFESTFADSPSSGEAADEEEVHETIENLRALGYIR